MAKQENSSINDEDTRLLQKWLKMDPDKMIKTIKNLVIVFSSVLILNIVFMISIGLFSNNTIRDMYREYISNTEDVILTRSEIDLANQWERLPVNQRKERLRAQYYEIVRYYTNNIPPEQKMNDDQILESFNQLWICIQRLPHVNFFFPVAYMKVASNYNPVSNVAWKRGIASFYSKMGERIANLHLARTDPVFQTVYKGIETLNNPTESIKLLIVRIDDLMSTFNNREDWVILSLFTNEYDVIDKYWEGGDGKIPDELYEKGELAETLKYFYAFKNWQIPSVANLDE